MKRTWPKLLAWLLGALLLSSSSFAADQAAAVVAGDQSTPPIQPEADLGAEKSTALPPRASVTDPQEANGAFVYSIPIDLPPGVRGSAPSLKIQYNSTRDSSFLGQGWSISGLSSVSRCGASRRHDGTSSPPTKGESDALCLDGERLLLRTGVHLKVGAVYRLERRPNAQLTAVTSQVDQNALVFRLDWGDSSNQYFGVTENSLLKYPQSAVGKSWALTKTIDPYGNAIRFEYEKENDLGDIHVTKISYGGDDAAVVRTVEFTYKAQSRRTSAIIAGGRREIPKLLEAISIKLGGTLVSRYELAYAPSSVKQAPLLQSIRKCGPTTCLPATMVSWQPDLPQSNIFVSATVTNGFHGAGSVRWMEDINGDGLRDYVAKTNDGCIHWVLRTRDGWSPRQTQCGVHGIGAEAWLVDINGDGLPDYVTKTDNDQIHWDLNNGSGYDSANAFGPPKSQSGVHGIGSTRWLIDINADGYPDYVAKTNDGNIHWNLNNGDGTWGPPITQGGVHGLGSTRWLKDINGDGLPDYVAKTDDGNIHWDLNVFRPGATSVLFGPPQTQGGVHGLGAARWLIDINGDGLPDYVAKTSDGNIHWDLNTGTGWGPPVTQGGVHGLGTVQWLADIDGDGLPDYVAKNDDGLIHWNLNLGAGYDTATAFGPPMSQSIGPGLGADRWVVDVTGDGRADYVAIDGSQAVHVAGATKSPPAGLLIQVKDPIGAITSIDYAPLTASADVYRVSALRLPSSTSSLLVSTPDYVVQATTDRISGRTDLVNTYTYENLRYDYVENRLVGFSTITKYDAFRSTRKTKSFAQIYPFDGLPTKEITASSTSITLGEVATDWELSPKSEFGLYPVVASRVETKNTIDGTFERRTIERNSYNQFAQLTTSTLDASDNIQRAIIYDIENDANKWQLGRVLGENESLRASSGQQTTIVRRYTRNAAGDVTRLEEKRSGAENSVSEWKYTTGGLVESRSQGEAASKRIWTYSYDAFGLIKSRVNPKNQIEEYTYDPRFGKPTSYKLGGKARHRFEYDELGRLSLRVESSGKQEQSEYSIAQEAGTFSVRKKSTSGSLQEETYDATGTLIATQVVGFSGRLVRKENGYDAAGRTTSESLPFYVGDSPSLTTIRYDVLDREIERLTPWGETIRTDYGKLSRTVFSNSKQRNGSIVDSSDQPIELTEFGGPNLQLERDPGNGIRKALVGGALLSSYSLDGASRITSSFEPGRGSRSYVWNSFGELVRELLPTGQAITTTYDSLGRSTERKAGSKSRKWKYDGDTNSTGALTESSSSDGIRDQFEYDEAGRAKTDVRSIGSNRYRIGRVFDASGRIAELILPGNLPNLRYIYTVNGDLEAIQLSASKLEIWRALDRDAQGRVTRQQQGKRILQEIQYEDGRSGVKSLRVQQAQGPELFNLTWVRDFRGNVLDVVDLAKQAQTSLSYDDLDRIKTFTSSRDFGDPQLASRAYEYNDFGDLTSNGALKYEYRNATQGRTLSLVSRAQPPPAASKPDYDVSYDAAGNPISDGLRLYRFNEFGELAQINHFRRRVECKYGRDAGGTISSKSCRGFDQQPNTPPLVEEHYFNNVFVRTARGGYYRDQFQVYAGDRLVAVIYGRVVKRDAQAAVPSDFFPADAEVVFPIADGLGSVIGVLKDDATPLVEYRYSAFGERATIAEGKRLTPQHFFFGFQGHYHDAEVGLISIGLRHYDPVLGRFVTPDLATDFTRTAQVTNRYSFALNNPLRFTDSSGLYIDEDGNEFAGPEHPDPERHQYKDWDAWERRDAGVRGYDNPREGRFYEFDRNSGKVREFIDKPVEPALFDPIDLAFPGVTKLLGAAERKLAQLAAKNAAQLGEGLLGSAAKEGIYWFESTSGKVYVGQSSNIPSRLAAHMRSGKLSSSGLDAVQTLEVRGGKLAREIAEQHKINELGGIRVLENVRNPIGPRREHLLKLSTPP